MREGEISQRKWKVVDCGYKGRGLHKLITHQTNNKFCYRFMLILWFGNFGLIFL